MRSFIFIFLSVLILGSCVDPLGQQSEVPGDLVETTLKIFPGEIMEQGSVKIDDIDVWKVKVMHASTAVTTFYWRKAFSNLYKIIGEKGPFDYEIRPPFDVVNFSTAKFLAFNQNGTDRMTSWEYFRNPVEMRWYYNFYVKDVSTPITIDAGSGEIVR